MSPFEEVFGLNPLGNEIPLKDSLATIRDKFTKEINSKIPQSSMMSSPACVMYAIYKLLEEDLEKKEYPSWEYKNRKEK